MQTREGGEVGRRTEFAEEGGGTYRDQSATEDDHRELKRGHGSEAHRGILGIIFFIITVGTRFESRRVLVRAKDGMMVDAGDDLLSVVGTFVFVFGHDCSCSRRCFGGRWVRGLSSQGFYNSVLYQVVECFLLLGFDNGLYSRCCNEMDEADIWVTTHGHLGVSANVRSYHAGTRARPRSSSSLWSKFRWRHETEVKRFDK